MKFNFEDMTVANTCKYSVLTLFLLLFGGNCAWGQAGNQPFIESLTGSISGNTLTLTARINYANIENQIKGTVQYHWVKAGQEIENAHNYVYTDNNAFTPTDINWEVYATYTYQDKQRSTERVRYIQKKPDLTLDGSVEGFDLTLTPTLNTCGVPVTNVQYFLLDEVSEETEGSAFVASQNAVNFDGKTWVAYATYEYNSQSYRSSCGTYYQEASALPTLTVVKDEEHDQSHDQLVMTASVSNEYAGKISAFTYHWSKNGGAEESEQGNTMTSQHSFATQEWSCYASFEYDSKTYATNVETYTYYSTLGHVTIKITDDGTNLTAKLYQARGNDELIDQEFVLPAGVTASYLWSDSKGESAYAKAATCAKPTNDAIWIECKVTLKDNNNETLEKYETYRLNQDAKVVVFIKYTDGGSDNNSGLDKDHPVATWKKAYSLLPRGGNWDNNIIVVVNGTKTDKAAQINNEDTDGKAATITGEWPWEGVKQVEGGRFYLGNDGYAKNSSSKNAYIGAPTKFKNIRMYACNGSQGRLCLMLHDTYFDEGIIMQNFGSLSGNMGETAGRVAPNFHLLLYTDRTETRNFNQPKPMNLTIKSGRYGRIMCTRIQGTTNTEIEQRYVVGRPDMPLKAVVNIDIPNTNPQGQNSSGVTNKIYTDDIAFLCAGTTQGTVYGDLVFNIKSGKIATLAGGSQGNAISQVQTYGLPVSTYYGRATVNIDCENKTDVQINKFYATCLGRNCSGSGTCNAYFYGHTTLNMKGGTINGGVYSTAGGIIGLKSGVHYTADPRIPYAKLNSESDGKSIREGVSYMAYNASRLLPSFNTFEINDDGSFGNEAQALDFNKGSKIVYNISGGEVKGGIFGGGQGCFLPDMPVANAPEAAGSIYADTEVNISGMAKIDGGVYGGGAGATDYYENAESAKKQNFLNVATVYGNTNVSITGTPDIQGNIYGGGAGVDATGAAGTDTEFLNIARVYGNTNVTFNADYTDDNPFTGNIYGGGAKGGVEGNTNVIIKKGVILGNVFGGSQGQEGYSNKAKVVGTTKVVIGE